MSKGAVQIVKYSAPGLVAIAFIIIVSCLWGFDKFDAHQSVSTIAIITGMFALFCLTKEDDNGDTGSSMGQIFIVFVIFLLTLFIMFLISWWATYMGTTTGELIGNVDASGNNTANTIVTANALIWTFALLAFMAYVMSYIGFMMSKLAKKIIVDSSTSSGDGTPNIGPGVQMEQAHQQAPCGSRHSAPPLARM